MFTSTDKMVALGYAAMQHEKHRRYQRSVALRISVSITFTLTMFGCSGPLVLSCREHGAAPYTSEHATRPFVLSTEAWFADGGPTILTVHNPTASFQQVHVMCRPSIPTTSIDYEHDEWWTCLEAHQEKIRFVEFMNVDALQPVCEVDEAFSVGRSFCYQHDE